MHIRPRHNNAPAAVLLLALIVITCPAEAAIALQQSRVIFNGEKSSASLLVNNQNQHAPYLAQGWIENEQGKKIHGPLLLLPPIQRIEPGAQSQIKIRGLPAANLLRQDRETLFWLNLREIPPRHSSPNTLNIALQNRIKVFYRPAALKAPPGELATPWHTQLVLEQQGDRLQIRNPSPYYITLVEAQSRAQGQAVPGFTPLMLAPAASETLPGKAADYGNTPVLTYLNDYGGRPEIAFRCEARRCSVISNRVPKG